MDIELKPLLDELQGLIANWNRGKIPKEEEFIDGIRPLILKIKERIENPQKEQTQIV